MKNRFKVTSLVCWKLVIFWLASASAVTQIYGQTCPEPYSQVFPENPPETLCGEMNTLSYPFEFGGIINLATQIVLLNSSATFTGNILLTGDLTIDCDLTFLNCNIKILPGVKIEVESGVKLTLDGSNLFSCDGMWEGIDLAYTSEIETLNATEIEDAKVAIESPCTASLSIKNTIFDRNIVGIRLGKDGAVFDPCPIYPVFTQFSGNEFDCTSPLNGTTNGVSLAGIQIFFTPVSIGGLTSSYNYFRNMRYGIRFESQVYSSNSAAVTRCDFDKLLIDGVFMNNGRLTVVRSNFKNCGYKEININQTSGLTIHHCEFYYDDEVANQPLIYFDIYRFITISKFLFGSQVYIYANKFACEFTNTENQEQIRGIELVGGMDMGSGTKISITDNNFNCVFKTTTTAAYGGNNVIYITGVFPEDTETVIQGNEFYINQIDNHSVKVRAIYVIDGNKSNVKIHGNNFDSSPPTGGLLPLGTHEDYPIVFFGSITEGNEIVDNKTMYDPSTPFSANFRVGISAAAHNLLICYNEIHEGYYAIVFEDISPGTQFLHNTLVGGGASLAVFGYIGEQGVEDGFHNGNKFYDKWANIHPTYHAWHDPAVNAPLSRIWVNTEQSVYNPDNIGFSFFSEYYPASISPGQDGEWFTKDLDGAVASPECITMYSVTKTDKDIADGTLENIMGLPDSTAIWMSKRYLFNKLLNHPSLQSEYSAFSSFVTSESQTDIGKLYNVEQEIKKALKPAAWIKTAIDNINNDRDILSDSLEIVDSILNNITISAQVFSSTSSQKINIIYDIHLLDSLYSVLKELYSDSIALKLQSAITLNNLVSGSHVYENIEKSVNSIALNAIIYQDGILTSPQKLTLRDIAANCPKTCGQGVYNARGMLLGCDSDETWEDEDENCFGLLPFIEEVIVENKFSGTRVDLATSEVLLFPNPNVNGFYVQIPSDLFGYITLTNGLSEILMTSEIKIEESKKYFAVDLPSGLYFCKVQLSSGKQYTINNGS